MKICTKCYEIFKNSTSTVNDFCPRCTCLGNLIEIDELMIPVFIILNKNGYKTKFCCQGHIYNNIRTSYISFTENSYERIKNEHPNPPVGWVYDGNGLYPDPIKFECTTDGIDGYFEKYQNISKLINSLYDWIRTDFRNK